MSQFIKFKKFCECYQVQLSVEKALMSFGIVFDGEGVLSRNIDELISMIPDLIFTPDGVEMFWESLWDEHEFTDEFIEELWEKLKDYQLNEI